MNLSDGSHRKSVVPKPGMNDLHADWHQITSSRSRSASGMIEGVGESLDTTPSAFPRMALEDQNCLDGFGQSKN